MTTLFQTGARSESGIALIVLLATALFVGLVGVAMINQTVSEVQIAINQSHAVQARYLAEAGIADAANHLSVDNTWTGPVTQTLGGGSYTVQVDAATSQAGATGAVKSVVSTGSVLGGTAAGGTQTVRGTFLVLPWAFSKAAMLNGTFTMSTTGANGSTPTITNSVLRQLGAIHANNLASKTTSVTQAAGTAITGLVSASSGTISLSGSCIGCTPNTAALVPLLGTITNPAATIPFPTFNWQSGTNNYLTQAQNNPNYPGPTHSPCPTINTTGTLFTTQLAFNNCLAAIGGSGSVVNVTLNGVIFVNILSLSAFNFPDSKVFATGASVTITINGTLAVFAQTTLGNTCVAPAACGDLAFLDTSTNKYGSQNLVFTAQNGDPAIMTGGNILTNTANCNGAPGIITITGLVYMLNQTTDVTKLVTSPGYCLNGSSTVPVTIRGLLVGNIVGTPGFASNSLTYDPSSFFPGLPTGLISPGPPFVILPISWSSAK